ncbi:MULTISPECIES: MprA protease, GlyGly-CTERM protein-sorting domain-containing form [Subtercola]|nr:MULTISPECIES: MprA protease, GlyGly-CTERM protein-sorting domain-containing form [Subtercola]MEA9984864.1 MprA protease, GlyGly-CTERM protein-sorting domain-containing form [Subtercola sp. RTI3]
MKWDEANKQFLINADLSATYNTGQDGADATYLGYSVYATQAGSASPMTYKTVASNGVLSEPGDPFSLSPTDALPTYALGDVATGSTATADYMIAVEMGTASGTGWGIDFHYSGKFQCPVITGAYTTDGTVGTTYASTVGATAEGAVTYSVAAGSLPDGLTLDPTTGAITGTPTTGGTTSFTVYATDAWGEYTSIDATIAVPAVAVVTPTPTATPTAAPAVVAAAPTATAVAASKTSSLAETGNDVIVPMSAGVLLLLAGIAGFVLRRHRRTGAIE